MTRDEELRSMVSELLKRVTFSKPFKGRKQPTWGLVSIHKDEDARIKELLKTEES